MEVVVASHPASLLHDTGIGHPESPERVHAVRQGIEESGMDIIDVFAPETAIDLLELAHDSDYIEMISERCSVGGGALDMDTVVSPGSWEAALRSVGAVVALADEVTRRGDATGFALTRPPGHHATRNRAMGFCLFNNVAVAAKALKRDGHRVAILDWDVHHGNGTQAIVGDDPGILYVSLHQQGHYPLEGFVSDIDRAPEATIVNVPLPHGTGGDVYRRAWQELVIPVLVGFAPAWVLISAGYDAHAADPLAGLSLIADDYGWIASRLAEVHPTHRTIFALEGGYDLDALRMSVTATIVGLSGNGFGEPSPSPPQSLEALEIARLAIAKHWPL